MRVLSLRCAALLLQITVSPKLKPAWFLPVSHGSGTPGNSHSTILSPKAETGDLSILGYAELQMDRGSPLPEHLDLGDRSR